MTEHLTLNKVATFPIKVTTPGTRADQRSRKNLGMLYMVQDLIEELEALDDMEEIEAMKTKHVDSLYKACMTFKCRLERRS